MNSTLDSDTVTEPQTITARAINLVDRNGLLRISLTVEDDGTAAVKFLDRDQHLRMILYLKEPDSNDDACFLDEGSDNDAGLIVAGRQSGNSIRLGISDDGFFGKRARLEIVEGRSWGKGRHRFPALPPNVSD